MTLQYLINASLSKFTNMSYSLTPLTVSGPLCLGHGHREDINIKLKDQLMSVNSRRPRNALYFQTGNEGLGKNPPNTRADHVGRGCLRVRTYKCKNTRQGEQRM